MLLPGVYMIYVYCQLTLMLVGGYLNREVKANLQKLLAFLKKFKEKPCPCHVLLPCFH